MESDNESPALLSQRKVDHIQLCRDAQVEARERTTLLEEVHLHHVALPELNVADLDLAVTFLGRRLPTPLMISGMTGGAPEAEDINRALARVAQRHGLAMGLGSQRAMLRDPALLRTYAVRQEAPDIFLCGNIGVVQAAAMSAQELADLVGSIDANALCIHLNPGQEIIQDHGDRDFRGGYDALARAIEALDIPVIAKETGCGLSAQVLHALRERGVTAVDVSGAGGTTWVGVEALRGSPRRRAMGELLWDWGIPTAVSIHWASRAGLQTIASGGLRTGLDMARSLALGAHVASAALPWLRAVTQGGEAAADEVAELSLETLRAVLLLTGSPTIEALQKAPRTLGSTLERWLQPRS